MENAMEIVENKVVELKPKTTKRIEKVSIDNVLQKREHVNELLLRWKRKLESAQRKVRKYRENKKLYTSQLMSLTR